MTSPPSRRSTIFTLLPDALQKIVKNLDTNDLFWLSTCSKKSFNLIQNTIAAMGRNWDINVEFHKFFSISLAQERMVLRWNFYRKRDKRIFGIERTTKTKTKTPRTVKMHHDDNPKSLTFWKQTSERLIKNFGSASKSIEDVLQFTQHIVSLFGDSASIQRLSISPEHTDNLELIQSFEAFRRIDNVTVTHGTISHQAFRRILEGFEAKGVYTSCAVEPGYQFNPNHTPQTLNLEIGTWFTGEMLMNISNNCKMLEVEYSKLTETDVKLFILKWLQSDCEEELFFPFLRAFNNTSMNIKDDWCLDGNLEEWDLPMIAQGLENFLVGDEPDNFPEPSFIVQRPSDGMMMIVQVQERDDEEEEGSRLFLEAPYG